jgi:hypothetical protein
MQESQSQVASPVELSAQLDSALRSLLVRVGQSLRARSRLQSTLRILRAKSASPLHQLSNEELVVLQQYQDGRGQGIPGIKALEMECYRYDALVKQLGSWIERAKEALEIELEKAKAREEVEREVQRVKEEEMQKLLAEESAKREAEAEAAAVAAAAAAAAAAELTANEDTVAGEGEPVGLDKQVEQTFGDTIVIDDDEDDDDDKPLAIKDVPLATKMGDDVIQSDAIDLTDDSPLVAKSTLATGSIPTTATAPESDQSMQIADSAALIASLTAMSGNQANDQGDNAAAAAANSMALDNFDFSQLGLQQMDGLSGFTDSDLQTNNYQSNEQLDGFSMDFLDFSSFGGDDAAGGPDDMVDSSNLFGSIDFSSILGSGDGSNEGKKE